VKKALTGEELELRMAEEVWLNYFNRYLFECGALSEKEYKQMTEKIAARSSRLSLSRGA
jgi:hypothetical protein